MTEGEGICCASDALSDLVESLNRCKREALRPGSIGRSAFFSTTGIQIFGEPSELLIKALSDWDVMDSAENGNVPRYPALIEADAGLLCAIDGLNSSKLAFKTAAASIEAATDKDRQRKLREVFKKLHLARAHPLQCWREVRVFRWPSLQTVGFTTSTKSFSSKVMTRVQAIRELEKRDADREIREIERTAYQSVRWVNPVSPYIRVNLSYRAENRNLINATFHASLPIIIEKGAWPAKLNFNQPKETPQDRKGGAQAGEVVQLLFRKDAYLALS